MGNGINKQIFLPPKVNYSEIQTSNNYNVVSNSFLISKTGELITEGEEFISICCFTPILNYNKKPHKVVVWAHGNATDIKNSYNLGVQLASELEENVIFFDYFGYGLSSGDEASEQKCYESITGVMNYVLEKYKYENIIIVGHSIGTGIVVDWAEKYGWKRPIVLISPYTSLFSIVTNLVPYFMDKFVTIKKVPNLLCPVKIYHGIYDNLININHSKKIYNELPNKSLKPTYFDATGHDNILDKINWSDIKDLLNIP